MAGVPCDRSMGAAVDHDPVRGSNRPATTESIPASVTRTLPSDSRVVDSLTSMPGLDCSGAAVQAPVAGSYVSTDCGSPRADPPITSTLPSGVQEGFDGLARGAGMFAIAVHVPASGSYSSAESVGWSPGAWPPATSTLPSGSRMATWLWRGSIIFPVAVHVPLSGRTARQCRCSRRRGPCHRAATWPCFRHHRHGPSSPWRSRSRSTGSYTSAPSTGSSAAGSSMSPTSTLPSRSNVARKPW